MQKSSVLIAVALALVVIPAVSFAASGAAYYVSPTDGNDKNTGESPAAPFATIFKASAQVKPGDTVYLMSGKYKESIIPVHSGTQTAPITYQAYSPNNRPVIVSPSLRETAVVINDVSWITIKDIDINGGGTYNYRNHSFASFVWVQGNSSHITITNGNFQHANGYNGVWVLDTASYVTLSNCIIDDVGFFASADGSTAGANGFLAGDVIAIDSTVNRMAPHHILVENNKLTHGGHDLITVAGQSNVIQNNTLDNDWSNIPPVTGTHGYRNGALEGTNNVFQGNFLSHAGPGIDGNFVYTAIMKVQGAGNIFRQNVLAWGNYRGIMSDQYDGDRSNQLGTAGNDRIYNNTLYQIGSMAWEAFFLSGGGCPAQGCDRAGDVFKNNLVEQDRTNPSFSPDANNDVYINFSGPFGPTSSESVINNLFDPANHQSVAFSYVGSGLKSQSISEAEAAFPSFFAGNIQAKPIFVSSNPKSYDDFALATGSPGIQAGAFLTTTTGFGTSKTVTVADALYFTDGVGLIPGDTIRLQGSNQTAQITTVDYTNKTLTLSTAVTFGRGQGIALTYKGSAPDIGAVPYGGRTPAPPPPGSPGPGANGAQGSDSASAGHEVPGVDSTAVAHAQGGCDVSGATPSSVPFALSLLGIAAALMRRRSAD